MHPLAYHRFLLRRLLDAVSNSTSDPEAFQLVTYAPSIFTIDSPRPGQGAILISDGAIAAPVGAVPGARPASPGEVVEIFCAGLGLPDSSLPLVKRQVRL
jgi:uncharacterized protein (TIGR03437 family)